MFRVKARVLLLALFAAMAVGAIASESASAAPQWLIEGVAFNGTETIATSTLGGLLRLKSSLPGGAEITIGCEGINALGAHITAKNKDNAAGIEFNKCKVDVPAANCAVSATLLTKGLTSELVELTAGKAPMFDTFAPTTGEEFISLALTGSACEGIFKVKNKTACEVLEPEVSAIIKLCNFKNNLFNTLKFGTQSAELNGTVGFQLAGVKKGQKWSANV